MSTVGRILGAAGLATGIIGAAALGGVTAQRMAVKRYRSALTDLTREELLGELTPDRTYSVAAEDGVVLHVEEVGPVNAPLTIIFAHGWTLRSGSWHFQRLGLAGPGFGTGEPGSPATRMVFYDHRSHGKSTRAPAAHSTMEYLASDLRHVIATATPDAPIVLVGHSMGGMAILTLAAQEPALFADPVIFERGLAGSRDAVWLLTRSLGFAKDVPGPLVDYLDEMISSTPVEVIADYAPTLFSFDQSAALPALTGIPTAIISGDQDRLTPLARSQAIADVLPDAEFVIAHGTGHMTMMEDPDLTNEALRRMLERATSYGGISVKRRKVRR